MKILHSSKDCEVAFLESSYRTIFVRTINYYLHLPNLLFIKSKTTCPCKVQGFFMVAIEREIINLNEPIRAWITPFNHCHLGTLCMNLDNSWTQTQHLSIANLIDLTFNSSFNINSKIVFDQWCKNNWFSNIRIRYLRDGVLLNSHKDDCHYKEFLGFPAATYFGDTKISNDYFDYLQNIGFSIPETQ